MRKTCFQHFAKTIVLNQIVHWSLTKLCAVSLLQGFVVEILTADLSYCCVSEKCKLASIQVRLEEVPGLKA